VTEPVITHLRDRITDADGQIEQDYRYLVYDFGDDMIARTYFDTFEKVSVLRPGPVPEPVLAYLRARFDVIDQLGRQGYETIWTA
jgi:hypothetical protein